MTVFLGCGFAAKYREGGGNFSVPLQWMLGLRRLKCDAVWLEHFPATQDPAADRQAILSFQRHLREHGLSGRYCLVYQSPAGTEHHLEEMECIGMSRRALRERLSGPNLLLNLSYSIRPPLVLEFERRIFCDLDPGEIFFWMTKMEMGQSSHHEFWTIGLNAHGRDCGLPRLPLKWQTFFPVVDTRLIRLEPAPATPKFTTIGQWYWDGAIEVDGEYPDLSKKAAFEQYLALPQRVPGARFELAMNLGLDEVEQRRLEQSGWKVVDPHRVARTPSIYRRYLGSASAEFTAIKGVDTRWKTGWLSDRAAAFLAMGRPVITEDTGAARYLPGRSGFQFVGDLAGAAAAAQAVVADWEKWSKEARNCAVEVFDGEKTLRKILKL